MHRNEMRYEDEQLHEFMNHDVEVDLQSRNKAPSTPVTGSCVGIATAVASSRRAAMSMGSFPNSFLQRGHPYLLRSALNSKKGDVSPVVDSL